MFFAGFLLWLSLLFQGYKRESQDWKLLWKTPVQGNQVFLDNLGSPYILKGDQLIKLRDNGQVFRQYSNKSLGNINSVDIMNPLKILLFYKDFSRLVFLDNTITENGSPIFLDDMGLEFATLACSSYDNGFWIFDQVQYRLIRFNQNLQITNQVLNLNQLIGKKIQPVFMTEQENNLYLNDPNVGILRFDIFGNYVNTIHIIGVKKIYVYDKHIVYADSSDSLVFYGLKTFKEKKYKLPENNFRDYFFQKKMLSILKEDSLKMYKLID